MSGTINGRRTSPSHESDNFQIPAKKTNQSLTKNNVEAGGSTLLEEFETYMGGRPLKSRISFNELSKDRSFEYMKGERDLLKTNNFYLGSKLKDVHNFILARRDPSKASVFPANFRFLNNKDVSPEELKFLKEPHFYLSCSLKDALAFLKQRKSTRLERRANPSDQRQKIEEENVRGLNRAGEDTNPRFKLEHLEHFCKGVITATEDINSKRIEARNITPDTISFNTKTLEFKFNDICAGDKAFRGTPWNIAEAGVTVMLIAIAASADGEERQLKGKAVQYFLKHLQIAEEWTKHSATLEDKDCVIATLRTKETALNHHMKTLESLEYNLKAFEIAVDVPGENTDPVGATFNLGIRMFHDAVMKAKERLQYQIDILHLTSAHPDGATLLWDKVGQYLVTLKLYVPEKSVRSKIDDHPFKERIDFESTLNRGIKVFSDKTQIKPTYLPALCECVVKALQSVSDERMLPRNIRLDTISYDGETLAFQVKEATLDEMAFRGTPWNIADAGVTVILAAMAAKETPVTKFEVDTLQYLNRYFKEIENRIGSLNSNDENSNEDETTMRAIHTVEYDLASFGKGRVIKYEDSNDPVEMAFNIGVAICQVAVKEAQERLRLKIGHKDAGAFLHAQTRDRLAALAEDPFITANDDVTENLQILMYKLDEMPSKQF